VDANFKLKGKARKINDVELAPGMGCFVEENTYQQHLTQYVNESEVMSRPTGCWILRYIFTHHFCCRSALAFRNTMQLFVLQCGARQATMLLAQGLSSVHVMVLSVTTALETSRKEKGV
jgi:hypothetical protein